VQELEPEPRSARLGERVGEKARARVVEVDHGHEVDSRAVRLLRDRSPDPLDLCRRARRHPARHGDRAADDAG
jgi:hypothetical protein